jgi:site-specific DNA-adenine methylase
MFKCFFSYYGSKSKIASKYPAAKYGKIVEPFCGAANYSVQNFENEVYLTDLNENIIEVWEFLINASEKDILELPRFKAGLDLRTLNLSESERKFCGFWANRGSRNPCNIVSKWAGASNGAGYFENVKKEVAANLYRIRHWKIKKLSYEDLQTDFKATWFIDPPYQKGGEHYAKSNIDYKQLAEFCKSVKGLAIVCENENGNWLDFKPIVKNTGSVRTLMEVVWISENV